MQRKRKVWSGTCSCVDVMIPITLGIATGFHQADGGEEEKLQGHKDGEKLELSYTCNPCRIGFLELSIMTRNRKQIRHCDWEYTSIFHMQHENKHFKKQQVYLSHVVFYFLYYLYILLLVVTYGIYFMTYSLKKKVLNLLFIIFYNLSNSQSQERNFD